MDSSADSVDNQLEQTLLQSYDKQAVAKLLDKKVGQQRRAEWGELSSPAPDKRAKNFEGSEEEKEYLVSKVEMLEAELKTEKAYRSHFEEKARKEVRNVRKFEDYVRNLKMQLKLANQQSSSNKFETLKSKLLVRIGDIEKDTIETKAVVAAELKNISDIKKPLENVNKLVEFLKTELDARDKKVEEHEIMLVEKDKTILDMQARLPSGKSTNVPSEMKQIADLIKCSEELNSEMTKITRCSEDKDETILKLKLELKEKTASTVRLTEDLENLTSANKKLVSKKDKLADSYDELDRYLTKTEKKLDKKKTKLEKLTLENESVQSEMESLKELNGNILEQMSALKEESVLLRERIAYKDAQLLRSESKLKLSKEELKIDVLHSFELTRENMRNQIMKKEKDMASLRCEMVQRNIKVNKLLDENHTFKIEVEKLKMEINMSIRNQKAEMKKERQLQESTNRQLTDTIKLLKSQINTLENKCVQKGSITEDDDMPARNDVDGIDEPAQDSFEKMTGISVFSDENANQLNLQPCPGLQPIDDETQLTEIQMDERSEVTAAAVARVGNTGHHNLDVVASNVSGVGADMGENTIVTSCEDKMPSLKVKDVEESNTEHLVEVLSEHGFEIETVENSRDMKKLRYEVETVSADVGSGR